MIDFACKQFDLHEIIKCSLGLTKADLKVFELLLKHPDDATADELAQRLALDLTTVQRSVKKLHEKRIVKRLQINLEGGGYVFQYRIADKRAIRKVILDTVNTWTKRVEDELERW